MLTKIFFNNTIPIDKIVNQNIIGIIYKKKKIIIIIINIWVFHKLNIIDKINKMANTSYKLGRDYKI